MGNSFQSQHFQTRARWIPFTCPSTFIHFDWQANKLATKKGAKLSCNQCGTQFGKKSNLELHMLMHKGEGGRLKKKGEKEKA